MSVLTKDTLTIIADYSDICSFKNLLCTNKYYYKFKDLIKDKFDFKYPNDISYFIDKDISDQILLSSTISEIPMDDNDIHDNKYYINYNIENPSSEEIKKIIMNNLLFSKQLSLDKIGSLAYVFYTILCNYIDLILTQSNIPLYSVKYITFKSIKHPIFILKNKNVIRNSPFFIKNFKIVKNYEIIIDFFDLYNKLFKNTICSSQSNNQEISIFNNQEISIFNISLINISMIGILSIIGLYKFYNYMKRK